MSAKHIAIAILATSGAGLIVVNNQGALTTIESKLFISTESDQKSDQLATFRKMSKIMDDAAHPRKQLSAEEKHNLDHMFDTEIVDEAFVGRDLGMKKHSEKSASNAADNSKE